MKRVFLLIVIPALLVALGFAQTPAASINTDQTNIKGCLGGSDGNYTIAQDNTGHIFKITSSSVDLKPHLGHDVTLIGHKASSASADSSLAVTELNMISEHCAAPAAAPIATASTPSENAVTPAAAGAAPSPAPSATTSTVAETAVTPAAPAAPSAETAVTPAVAATEPAATVSIPTETAIAPPAPAAPSAETAVMPAMAATAPAAAVTTPAETVVTAPAPAATVSTPSETASTPAARHRRPPTTAAAATTKPAVTASKASEEPVSEPAAAATPPEATASTSPETLTPPIAAATPPAAPARRGSLSLLILFAVLVLVIGILIPSLNRWRKRKSLARTDAPNLSLIKEASSDQDKTDPQVPRKAA
jgi:hypothetical protein